MKKDPKYQFGENDQIWHRNGKYYIPDDEPVILFRGKDTGTLIAMKAYRKYMLNIEATDTNEETRRIAKEHRITITERINAIEKYINDHPERIGIGCHTCKHIKKETLVSTHDNQNNG